MEKFLERYNIPRLNKEEIENMNRSFASNETDKSKVSLEGRGMKQGEDLSKQNITSFEDATEGRDVNTLT